ncbi:MAG TPA: tetratricopeptide repeat protein [Sulfuricaulis sp.]|nr:tetratricopeptide repeat protein [Sulfuricaulis sp.]
MKTYAVENGKRPLRAALICILLGALTGGCATMAPPPEDAESADPRARVEQALANGDAAARGGDRELAMFHYVRALMDDERSVPALLRIATLHAADGKHEPAEQAYRRLLAVDERHAHGWEGLGLLMLHSSRQAQAGEYLRRAVELDPALWRAHNALGMIADLQGHPQAATDHYAAALALRPDEPQILNNLGYSKYLTREWPAAEAYFRAVLSRDPANPRAWSNMALLAARQGHYDKALDALKRVGTESQAYNNLGYLCLANEQYTDAEYFLREAVRLSPTYYPAAQKNLELLRARRFAN